ncbi:MAG: hypothetical protein ACP5JU_03855 [Minisyncoccia bacterium]
MDEKNDVVYVPMSIKEYINRFYKNALLYSYDDKTILVISIDDLDADPRKNDNLWTIIFFLRDYEIGDYKWKKEHGIRYSVDLKDYLQENYDNSQDYILAGLIFRDYRHYGEIEDYEIIDIEDMDGYDGYAFVNKQDVIKYLGNEKEVMLDLLNDRDLIKSAIDILEKEILILNCYLCNEVYSYTLIDRNTMNIIDESHYFYCRNSIKNMRNYVDVQYQHLFDELKDRWDDIYE